MGNTVSMNEENRKIKSSELRGKNIAIGQITFTSIRAYHMLQKDGVEVSMFFDRDFRMQHRMYKKTPIFPWANFHDVYVVLTIPGRYGELREMLIHSCGYKEDRVILLDEIDFECNELDVCQEYDWIWLTDNVRDVSDAYIHYRYCIFKQKGVLDHGLQIPFMSIGVNNKCTLNCEYCYTQTPYYQPEEKRNYDIDNMVRKLDQLLDHIDYISGLEIIGGEPLLHPKLHRLVSFLNGTKAQDKILHAEILTNGTLVLADELIEAIKENPLFWRISVSPYGVLSKKQHELFTQLNHAGIPYYSRYMSVWQKFGQVTEPESTSEEYIQSKCEHCCIDHDLHFADGKLYRCSVLFHFEALHRIPYDERNSIDCSKPYTKKDLMHFLKSYPSGMAYCNANHQIHLKNKSEKDQYGGEIIPVAEQAEGVLPYKRYE